MSALKVRAFRFTRRPVRHRRPYWNPRLAANDTPSSTRMRQLRNPRRRAWGIEEGLEDDRYEGGERLVGRADSPMANFRLRAALAIVPLSQLRQTYERDYRLDEEIP